MPVRPETLRLGARETAAADTVAREQVWDTIGKGALDLTPLYPPRPSA
jgi:hypothetical protein